MEVLRELSRFDHITYYDEPHIYLINGKQQTSVTTLLGKYKEKFNADFWSQRKADERGISKEEVLAEWAAINEMATTKGTIIHNYIENGIYGKIFPYTNPFEKIRIPGGIEPPYEVLKEKVGKLQVMADKFMNDIRGKLLPIRSELVVGEEKLGICGMVDQLFFNNKMMELQIWDWKTNKKLARFNEYGKKLLGILSHLDECEFTIYSLQLSIYKLLIQRNTGLVLGTSYIVWFFEDNDTYEVIQCLDLSREAELIFDDYVIVE